MRTLRCFFIALSIWAGLALSITAQSTSTQIRPSAIKPTSSPSSQRIGSKIVFPTVAEFRMGNGIKVFVIEDQTQERTILQVQCGGGSAMDAVGKEGASAVLVQALASCVQSRVNGLASSSTADAHLSAAHRTAVAAQSGKDAFSLRISLPSHKLHPVIKIVSETLAHPSFLNPTDVSEVNAARQHVLIANQVAQGSAEGKRLTLEAMAAQTIFGADHAYARQASEQSLRSLTHTDIQTAHTHLCMPNNTTLVLIGKTTKKTLFPMLAKTFGTWKTGTAPYMPRPRPQPMEQGIYWVETKSDAPTIALAFESPPRNDIDYITTALAALLLERRINAKLDKADSTLSASFILSDNKYANVLLCRKSINGDSTKQKSQLEALTAAHSLIYDELKRFIDEPPADKGTELAIGKDILLERYARHLRQPEMLSSMLLNADASGLSLKELQRYPKQILTISLAAIRTAASQILQSPPSLIVLGSSALLPALQTLGKVYRYSATGEPIMTMEESDITLDSLLMLHTQALGGTVAVMNISTLITVTQTQLSAMAQKFPGTILTKQKMPNKIARKLEIPATQIVQELWCNGTTAFDKIEMMGQEQPLTQRTAKETESALFDAQIFPTLTMQSCGFTPELLGRRDGNYIVKASTEQGSVKILTFDRTTYLLATIEELRQTPQGIIKSVQEFRDYGTFEGVKLPTTIVLKTGPGTLIGKNSYQINQPLDDQLFQPLR